MSTSNATMQVITFTSRLPGKRPSKVKKKHLPLSSIPLHGDSDSARPYVTFRLSCLFSSNVSWDSSSLTSHFPMTLCSNHRFSKLYEHFTKNQLPIWDNSPLLYVKPIPLCVLVAKKLEVEEERSFNAKPLTNFKSI